MSLFLNFIRQTDWKKKLRPNSLNFLLPVSLLLFIIGCFNIVKETNGKENTAQLQKDIYIHEKNLSEKLTAFLTDLGPPESSYNLFNYTAKKYTDKYTDFFIYQNKSLINTYRPIQPRNGRKVLINSRFLKRLTPPIKILLFLLKATKGNRVERLQLGQAQCCCWLFHLS